MSFGDQYGFTPAQKLGCAAYAVIGGLITFYFMASAALGDCPSKDACISKAMRDLMFFGTPLVTLVGGVLLTRYFMRDKN